MRRYKRDSSKLRASKKEKGQLNIEFTGGAILFFVTLIFLLGAVLSNIPKHTGQAKIDQLALVSRSLTDKLIGHQGYYHNPSTGNEGSRWEDNSGHVVSLGLAKSNHRLAQDKIDAMRDDLNKTKIQSALGLRQVGIEYNLSLTRLIPVKTTNVFQKGDGSVYGINEPSGGGDFELHYNQTEPTIHYGSRRIVGDAITDDAYHVLIGNRTGDYHYWISQDTNFEKTAATNDMEYEVADRLGRDVRIGSATDYRLGQRSGVEASRGNLIIFQKEIASKGFTPPPGTGNILQTRRYATLGNDTVKLVLRVWRR